MPYRTQLSCLSALTTILMASVVAAQTGPATPAGPTAKLPSTAQPMALNGRGVRTDANGPLYSASLFLSAPARNAEDALAQNGARLMKVRMLRAVSGDQMRALLASGLVDNNSEDALFPLVSEVFELGRLIGKHGNMRSGDGFDIEWTTANTTRITVLRGTDQRATKQTFSKQDLAAPMMRIWLGEKPADARLKQALLGQAA